MRVPAEVHPNGPAVRAGWPATESGLASRSAGASVEATRATSCPLLKGRSPAATYALFRSALGAAHVVMPTGSLPMQLAMPIAPPALTRFGLRGRYWRVSTGRCFRHGRRAAAPRARRGSSKGFGATTAASPSPALRRAARHDCRFTARSIRRPVTQPTGYARKPKKRPHLAIRPKANPQKLPPCSATALAFPSFPLASTRLSIVYARDRDVRPRRATARIAARAAPINASGPGSGSSPGGSRLMKS